MANEVILLGFYFSGFGMRARIALAEKGIAYEYREEDLGNKTPLLLEMNPINKKIPVLIHNGKPICESLIIVEYIDEVWPNSPLLPSDPYQRAHARFWADFIDKKMYEPFHGILLKMGEEKEASKKNMIEALRLLEGQLGDNPYFGGENFGFLDVALIPYYCWFEAFELNGDCSTKEHCTKIMEWGKRCMEKESVYKSLADPKKIIDYASLLKKKYGVE